MRLNSKEIQSIVRIAKEIYGEDVSIYLFGSRTDDTKRGGDIDLLIRTESPKKGILDRIRMKARLKQTERLAREFEICDRHIQRIHEALDALHAEIPMSVDFYAGLDQDQIRCMDQFIFRFSKLQDAMGAKLFRYVLTYLDEDVSSLPMRDVLNLLERFRIIDKADEWGYIRELRNEIAHDYPLLENDIVSVLNELISKVPLLESIYERLRQRIKSVSL